MTEATFIQHTYMLSFQKASLATDHCFNFRFFGCNPPTQFVRSLLLATLAKKNTLGEVDKINLRTRFAASQYISICGLMIRKKVAIRGMQ